MWEESTARRVLETLSDRGESVATAESLTGGLLAARLTDVPGASRSFVGGVVSYATRIKVSVLDVPAEIVDEHGVVSEECARAMAQGVRTRLGADWGLATTGVAGPDEQEGRPVGTVWIAVVGERVGERVGEKVGEKVVEARLLDLAGDRVAIRQASCDAVLSLLGDLLREEGGLG